jgi:hypothetical protein
MNPQRSRRALKRAARRREAFAHHLVSMGEDRGAERETADIAGKATDVPKISETRDAAATPSAKQGATPVVEKERVEESAPAARPSRSSRRRRKRRSRRNVGSEGANSPAARRAPSSGTPAANPPKADAAPEERAPSSDAAPNESPPSATLAPSSLQSAALAELGIVAIHTAPRQGARRGESRYVLREVFE